MNDLIEQILGDTFYDEGDGDGGNDTFKFGGVEVDLTAEPDVIAAQMAEAQKSYVESSNAGIQSAKDLKEKGLEFEIFKKEFKKQNPDNQEMKSMMAEMFKDGMAEFNKVAQKGREINLGRTIETKNQELRKDYNMLDTVAYDSAMKETLEMWNKQDPNIRSGEMYENIAKLSLGKAMKTNFVKIQDNAAMKTIMESPELQAKFIEEYVKRTGIDVNMPAGGFNNQESFTTQYEETQKAFKDERDSEKRKELAVKLSNLRNSGKQFGFKYD
jgi:hypothetical protein